MMNSENEDSKDANAEGNDLNSFDVLGRKIYLMSFHSKTKAQKIPTDCYPAGRLLFIYLFIYLFMSFVFPTKSFAWLASCLGFDGRHANDLVNVMA